MGVEIVGFEAVQGPAGAMTEGGHSANENGKLDQGNEPIKFGSHGDESVKKEVNEVSVANFPKDAVDEWPAPKQTHSFYFVRYQTYDDPKIKAKVDQVSREVETRNNARSQIIDALKAKRTDRGELVEQIKALRDDNRQIRSIVDEKFKDLQPLQQALGQLRSADHASRNGGLCSSEEELNSRIQGLQYIIQHESIELKEEKKILKEIRTLESTRTQVIANAAMIAKIEKVAPKEALQDQVKLMGGDLDGVKKEQQAVRSKIKQLDDAVKAIDKEISSLQDELSIVTEKRDKARDSIFQLRKQRDEDNACFYQSRMLLTKARNLAVTKDIKALEELSHAEVEKFMALWNSNKDFRDDYEKRILPALDRRQMSRDGRIRNPDEKPLVAVEASGAPVVETASKANSKPVREDTRSAPPDTLPVQKAQKDAKNKATGPKSVEEHIDVADEDISGLEKQTKESTPKDNKVDAEKLKELKRQEEIEKNKQALERKKKKAEKDAAKAAIRAQKEAEKAEKKLKEIIYLFEREKKAKKKGSSAPETQPEEPTEAVAEAAEPEKVTENVEAPVLAKAKVQKDSNLRNRGRPRGTESLPKAILKRKKSSTNYWLWAAPAAFLVVFFLALGYHYLL
ncbi:PREDICTED: proton [Prunus dulcis]|uniref:PREDICTED: proton n=1 Tax=Prunus dulcis TaxID=3755 RepID=A0A5E4EMR2_PRUDU|nr:PREDICTED: proton [Prunus dulcis]